MKVELLVISSSGNVFMHLLFPHRYKTIYNTYLSFLSERVLFSTNSNTRVDAMKTTNLFDILL